MAAGPPYARKISLRYSTMMPGMSPPMPQPLAMKLGTELYYFILYSFIIDWLSDLVSAICTCSVACCLVSYVVPAPWRNAPGVQSPACDHHSKSWCVHMHFSTVQHAGIAWHVSWPCRMPSFCHGLFIGTEKSAELPYVAVFSWLGCRLLHLLRGSA